MAGETATVPEALTSAAQHCRTGRLGEAEDICRRILDVDPDQPDALGMLGAIARQVGRGDLAVEFMTKALAARPNVPDTLYNLGLALQDTGRFEEAIAVCDKVLALRPEWAEAHTDKGNALSRLGRLDEALAAYRQAWTVGPGYAMAYYNAGVALHALGRFDEAIATYRQALAIAPDHPETHNALGASLYQQGRPAEAMELFETALALRPDMGEAMVNRSLIHFAAGRLREAWQGYEGRWNRLKGRPIRPFPQPWWDGRIIAAETLLIWGEQGVADKILGVGMLPDVLQRVGRCIVETDPRLVTLFERSFPGVVVVAETDPPSPRALTAQYQIPLFNLGRHFRNALSDFPNHDGYLKPDPAKVARWRAWLDGLGPELKVGLHWRGRLIDAARFRHYASLEQVAPILRVPGVTFVNLQYDSFTEDIETMRRMTGVDIHRAEGLDLTNDLDDLAALMQALDAVVGPATATGYLAGALGRPTWSNAYFPQCNAKEICGTGRAPWCPSIRTEVRAFGEDWGSALARMADHLREFAAARRRTAGGG